MVFLVVAKHRACLVLLALGGLFCPGLPVNGRRQGFRQPALLLATVMEIVIGFAGYFSDFKQALFVFLLAVFASKVRLKNRDMVPLGAIVALILSLGWFGRRLRMITGFFSARGRPTSDPCPLTDRLVKAVDMTTNLEITI